MNVQEYKNGIRRRLCKCPNYCCVIPRKDKLDVFYFMFEGEGDSNVIYRLWNKAIARYISNKKLEWYERDYSDWRDDK